MKRVYRKMGQLQPGSLWHRSLTAPAHGYGGLSMEKERKYGRNDRAGRLVYSPNEVFEITIFSETK